METKYREFCSFLTDFSGQTDRQTDMLVRQTDRLVGQTEMLVRQTDRHVGQTEMLVRHRQTCWTNRDAGQSDRQTDLLDRHRDAGQTDMLVKQTDILAQ